MKLQDALYNWLQMHIVADARPEDGAAAETLEFFAIILREDHGLTRFYVDGKDDDNIYIAYEQEGELRKQPFDRETAEKLLDDINSNPKYNQ
ncbi:hypothetical protein B5M42_022275 [Paenibacillus athensensis]|uniref:Uncharacterized protein n=1 Tax=Paenibacillus athensensis TaxID=1967502 RepID=A0A4Y8PR44_9BACL|nr:hypothetical protein [Paenibacillus athensensis]MCD1261533.1 hypothetical protein [Paenibacillus athensensis]